jgi:hypothetical protein
VGATISLGNRWIRISNGSCEKLFDDAIAVATAYVTTEVEAAYVARMCAQREKFYPGYSPDFETLFPTLEEKKFWIRCFYDAGRWLHQGRLENPPGGGASPAMWIFHTYWCAQLLRELINREDRGWVCNDEDSVLIAAENQRSMEEYRIRHAGVVRRGQAERQEEAKNRAIRDARYASRNCPECGYPCSDWLPKCRVCGFAIGRVQRRCESTDITSDPLGGG